MEMVGNIKQNTHYLYNYLNVANNKHYTLFGKGSYKESWLHEPFSNLKSVLLRKFVNNNFYKSPCGRSMKNN